MLNTSWRMYWVCRCLSAYFCKAEIVCLSCKSATGLMLFSQSRASLANCLGDLATQPLNPENGLIIPFAFLFELPALQQQSQPEKEQKRGSKALAPAQAPGQLFCGPSIALLTRAVVAQIQCDWVHAGCSQVRRKPSYFFQPCPKNTLAPQFARKAKAQVKIQAGNLHLCQFLESYWNLYLQKGWIAWQLLSHLFI